ncbi:hypothetical protein ACFS25_08810 [Spirosoma flavum]|uniref:Uncharacterized protein n=2 Tax=Spirosoma flavum TaxID=2048557 RepID=A0ABW6AEN8_9BACT
MISKVVSFNQHKALTFEGLVENYPDCCNVVVMERPFYQRPVVLAITTAVIVVGAFALAKLHIISFATQGVLTAIAVGIQIALYRQKK